MAQHAAFVLRPYHPSDAAAVVEVVNAAAQPLGMRRAVVDRTGHVRLIRYLPVDSKKVVVMNPQDEVVGYAYLADRDQHIIYEVGGAVHPSYQQQSIGTNLLAWAERLALSMSASSPAGVKTVLQTNLYEAEREASKLFTEHGFARVRAWLHFAIEFEAQPGVPPLPAGLHLRVMDLEQDADMIASAMEEAFADHWGTILISDPEAAANEAGEAAVEVPEDESFSNASGFCFVVVDERTNKAAGGILCNAKLVERDDTGRVGSVFVRPAYRRRGVGRALMGMAFRTFWQHGIRRVILDTDNDSFTKAPAFYTSLGMRQYRHEVLYEKEVRPGREVRRLHI